MPDSRFHVVAAVLAVTSALVLSPAGAAAQAVERAPAGQTVAVPRAEPQPLALNQNASETRNAFYKVLEQYPPSLGRVMRLDPTLMTNDSYLASYPNLAAFLRQYPQVPRNPGYFLERYDPNYVISQPTDPRRESLRMWRDAMEFLAAFAVFCVVMFALFSLVKYVVEYRRWHRISKVNAEVHNKILDRFGSNEELLAYVDSPAGRRFLEATPIASAGMPARSIGAPFGRILLSVQIGVILLALGVGFLLISGRAIEEVQPVLVSLAVLCFCLGVGSVVSAGASYVISRRLGLLPDAPAPRAEHIA